MTINATVLAYAGAPKVLLNEVAAGLMGSPFLYKPSASQRLGTPAEETNVIVCQAPGLMSSVWGFDGGPVRSGA